MKKVPVDKCYCCSGGFHSTPYTFEAVVSGIRYNLTQSNTTNYSLKVYNNQHTNDSSSPIPYITNRCFYFSGLSLNTGYFVTYIRQ